MIDGCKFPPALSIGCRVWTELGYIDHGPYDGSKITIPPKQGGKITATQKPYYSMDDLLYTVQWDNGQVSKHYARELFRIGRFQSRVEFEQAIEPVGPAEITVGPKGGFRHAKLELVYDGNRQKVEIFDRDTWVRLIEPLVVRSGYLVLKIKE